MNIKNIAFYHFFKPSFYLKSVQKTLHKHMVENGIKGTILLAQEGINVSLAGDPQNVDTFLDFLFETINIPKLEIKTSYSQDIPFLKAVVKIKPFIVAQPGTTPLNPNDKAAPYISPQELHNWMAQNKPMVLLDTRNDYEYQAGRFKGSVHLGTKHFRFFENDLQKAPQQWQETPVITFCTGGIRCEKAAGLMLKKGFREVYQLEGGILNYFKEMGRGYFEGNCFVFDDRIMLDEKLQPNKKGQSPTETVPFKSCNHEAYVI